MNKIINDAYSESIQLLKKISTDAGFTASFNEIDNYKRVWSRDGVVAGIAGLIDGDKKLISCFKKTLNTLKIFQDETGRIPSNVFLNKKNHISYGTTVGRIDATIWYIVGITQYTLRTKDNNFFKKHKKSVEKAFFYLKCLELNGKGLIYIPQGGDWADEYINHGYILFDQILYFIALDGYYKITKDKKILKKKNELRKLIEINYLPEKEDMENPYIYNKLLFKESIIKRKDSLPIAYFSSYSVKCHIDNFANSLLLLTKIPNKKNIKNIVKTIQEKFFNKKFPIIPAFHPVIKKQDPEWKKLETNFLFSFKNEPYEFHNGGLWPLVNGFLLASIKENGFKVEKQLEGFAEILAKDSYTFPEFYHGKNYQPMGVTSLGYSASAYIIAYNSIIKNKKVFL